MKALKLMVLAMAGLIAVAANAYYTETVDGITWKYTVENGTASVGSGTTSSPAVPTGTQGAITIPSTLGNYRVTRIGDYAFRGCNRLTSVTIPSGVTSIGYEAFYGCSGLTSVTIPSSVTSIGGSVFEDCRGLTSVTIPAGVTSIGDYAFHDCSGLMRFSVDDDNSNYSSRDGLLCDKNGTTLICCPAGLTSVTIPSGVTSIGYKAFYDCIGLTAVTIPSGVTSIGDQAFKFCNGLKSVTIPAGVTSIGDDAFEYCGGLTSVTIPSSVTSIGDFAFFDCSRLGAGVVIVDGCVLTVNGDCPKTVEIPQGTRLIAGGAFAFCRGLTAVTIPASVTSIGERAFIDCSALTEIKVEPGNAAYRFEDGMLFNKDKSELICCPAGKTGAVTIPSGVTSIGEGAFADCSGLTSVTIPSGVTSIGEGAFYGCSGLTAVTIPSGVTSIGGWTFAGCSGLTEVRIPESVTDIGEDAFDECYNLAAIDFEGTPPNGLEDAGINENAHVRYNVDYEEEWLPVLKACGFIDYEAHQFFLSDGTYTQTESGREWTFVIADGEASVGGGTDAAPAISDDTVGEVVIPSAFGRHAVTGIGDFAFAGCAGVTAVAVPASVARVGVDAFAGCEGLKTLEFAGLPPDGLETAGIGSQVSVLYNAFYADEWLPALMACGLSKHEAVVRDGRYVQTVDGLDWSFTVADGQVAVGSGVVGTAAIPSETQGTVVVPSAVRGLTVGSVGDYAFCGCRGVTAVVIPSSVTSIGANAFAGCDALATVYVDGDEERMREMLAAAGCDLGKCAVVCLDPPVISPPSGTVFGSAVKITISSAIPNAVIHYTTDGTEPTAESPVFKKFNLTAKATVKAVAVAEDGVVSQVAVAHYAKGVVEAPVIASSTGATFDSRGCTVSMTCPTGGVEIRYTLDGSEPTAESELYIAPFKVRETTTVKAIAVGHPDYFDSPVAELTLERVWSVGDALNATGQEFAFGGDADWRVTLDETAHDGVACMVSGEIGDDQATELRTAVNGSGKVLFWWDSSCEETDDPQFRWDYGSFLVDGEEVAWIDGETGWTQCEITVEGDGPHELVWRYEKDYSDYEGLDRIRVDQFAWMPDKMSEFVIYDGLEVPTRWLADHGLLGTDTPEVAVAKETGKRDGAGRKLTAGDEYLLGTDPNDADSLFRAKIAFDTDGKPIISWDPALNGLNPDGSGVREGARLYRVLGKESLGAGNWRPVSEGDEGQFRFFKVTVEMP